MANTGPDDPGFARLRAALLDRQGRRPGRQLAAAREATRPVAGLDDAEALLVAAPSPERSLGEMGRDVYRATRAQLEVRGVGWEAAHRVAARCAGGVVLELAGFGQRELAGVLGVSDRQVRLDRVLLRELGPDVLDGGVS